MSEEGHTGGAAVPLVACVFCRQTQDDGHRLVSGAPGRYICEDCVQICVELLAEETASGAN